MRTHYNELSLVVYLVRSVAGRGLERKTQVKRCYGINKLSSDCVFNKLNLKQERGEVGLEREVGTDILTKLSRQRAVARAPRVLRQPPSHRDLCANQLVEKEAGGGSGREHCLGHV